MFQLVIGNPELSSWSMRAWLAARLANIEFSEVIIQLDQRESKANLLNYNPNGTVPVLVHDDIFIGDSLAITIYLDNLLPESGMFPKDRKIRAQVLSLICEIHSSFMQLRTECPMDLISKHNLKTPLRDGLLQDLKRVIEIIDGREGPYLFGEYSIADCFMAPIVTRLQSYCLPVSDSTKIYMKAIFSQPDIREWLKKAELNHSSNNLLKNYP